MAIGLALALGLYLGYLTPLAMVKHLWTREEVLRMVEKGGLAPDSRLELICGELMERSPIGNEHSGKVDRLQTYFIKD